MNDMSPAVQEKSVRLTESAVKRVSWLIEQDGGSSLMLRLSVSGGGCSGFQYGFSFDDQVGPDDQVFTFGPVKLVIDDMSLDLVAGSEVDFVEDLMGASFQVKNPLASSSCGCGSSFSV